ncbi:MAG TPA: hypothetical protein VK569_07110, partial [Bacteroidota bacterium]|nr:hypothetical protein [Bacteroidota bacterium]
RFQFADLRPGDWILRVSGENLPEYHYLERDSVQLSVIPGERSQIALRVLPRRRKVQILQEGNIRREGEPPRVSPPPGKKEQDLGPGKPAPSRRQSKPRASLHGSSFQYCAAVGTLRLSCILR